MQANNLSRELTQIISTVVPDFSGKGNELLVEYNIDSFDLMTLRSLLEEQANLRFEDAQWARIQKFSDFVTLATDVQLTPKSAQAESSQRQYQLNMPQMNVCGLSEYWYLKEIGDMHWKLIASALKLPSDQIVDQQGRRLYATFVRIKINSKSALHMYQENDPLSLSASISRYGNFYLSENSAVSGRNRLDAELVTSFVARGSGNSELFKSTPAGEVVSPLKTFNEIPSLIEEYHAIRKEVLKTYQLDGFTFNLAKKVLFETQYSLDPFHDINGVGLLYFAAYPHIFDVCERAYMQQQAEKKDLAFSSSTGFRDIFYLGNSDVSDEIIYRLLDFKETKSAYYFAAELVRKSDGKRVSFCMTRKVLR